MLSKLLKIVSLLIILESFSFSAYLYSNEHKCIDSYYYQSGRFYYVYSDDNTTLRDTGYSNRNVFSGYVYDLENNICKKKPILEDLQIDNNTYYMLLGLVAVLVGFTFLFFGIYIAVDVAKK